MCSKSVKRGTEIRKQVQPGTVNAGYEYEELVPAYFALKLLLDKNVKSYTIEVNPSSYEKFDDVVITVKTIYNTTENFAIQLKHRVDGRNVANATEEFNRKDSNRKGKSFNISQYSEAYKNMNNYIQNNYNFILFTNTTFYNLNNIPNYKQSTVTQPFKTQFLNVNNILQFREKKKTTKFFDNFFLICGQENVDGMQNAIEQIFAKKFNAESEVATSYINFFKDLHNDKYNDTKITRDVVILNLTRFVFSNCTIRTPISKIPNSNIELVEAVIKIFDLVILPDIDKNIIKNYWNFICSEEEIKRMDDLARNIKFLQKTKTLNANQRIQLISYLIKKPLFVEFSQEYEQKIYFTSTLLKSLSNYKINLVLVGKRINEDKFQEWKIFRNLEDLASNHDLYERFTHVFNVSLQGRDLVRINKLKKVLCLDQLITPSEVFSFLKGNLLIGKGINALPTFHIPRSLLRTEIHLDALRNECANSTSVIHCDGKSAEFNDFLKNINFGIPVISNTNNKISDLQSNTPVLILTDEPHIRADHKFCYHFKLLEHNYLQCMDNKPIDPRMASIFESDKSLVYGRSGIGKTTMMTYLARNCPLNYWIVIVPSQQPSLIFKDDMTTEQIIKQFLIPSEASQLRARIIKKLLEEKQIIFFFDGLNELGYKYMIKLLNLIKSISEEGFKVWIFGTENIKYIIQSVLELTACYVIEDMTKEEQEKYIYDRLKSKNVDESIISNVTNKLFDSGVAKNNDIFKLPLVLYILTDILSCSKNVDEIEKLFKLEKMYASFVDGKLHHNLKKIGCDYLQKFTTIIDGFRDYYLNAYQIAALQTCLETELFRSINVKMDKKFYDYIEKNGDYLEFIQINQDDSFTFTHYTFAEYFAASWLSENIDDISLEIKQHFFKPRYDGIRRFFDENLAEGCPLHLAIIEQDLPKVKQLDEKYLNHTDKGGRTPLHLAVTSGMKHTLRSSKQIENEYYKPSASDYKKQEEILKFLLNKVPMEMLNKADNLFQLNPWEYANAALCLFSLEELSKREEIQWKYLKSYHNNSRTLSYYCVKMGYKNLLKLAIDQKSLPFLEKEHEKRPLLHLAFENHQPEVAKLLIDYGCDINRLDYMQRTPLQEAVIWGHADLIKLLLEKSENVNVQDALGRTALHIAAKRGYIDIARILTENKANVNSTDNEQKTALHRAARQGYTEIVQYLVGQDADINAAAEDGRTPLHQAAEMGHFETVKYLVEAGADKDVLNISEQTPLIYATEEGHEDIVRYLISEGADILAKDDDGRIARETAELRGHSGVARILREAEDSVHRTWPDSQKNVLHVAAENGNLETLKQWVQSGGNIEETNENSESVLHIAASHGHLPIVKYLLTKQANTAARNCDSRVPLHLACQNGHIEVVEELLKKGQLTAVDRWKITPLHRAALKNRKKIVKILVQAGADINCRDHKDATPLHSAAVGGHIDVLKYLISKGADIKAVNKKMKSCLHAAVQRGCTDAAEYLMNHSRDLLYDRDYRGRTALHFAVEKGYKNMVRILIQGGSDLSQVNYFRETALDAAIAENREEIIQLFSNNAKNT